MSTLPKPISGLTVIPVAYARSTLILYAHAHLSKSQDVVYPEKRTLFLVNIPVDATDREISLFFKSCGTVERVVYNRNSRDEAEAEAEEEEEETSPPLSPSPSSQDLQPRSKRKQRPTESASPSVIPLPPIPLRTLRNTGSIAHVIFLDTSSLEKVLVPPTKPRPWPSSSEEPRGLAHYAALYDAQRPSLDVVKVHADTWMEWFEFDLAKTKQKLAYRKGEAIVDNDGFTLVTRGGAYGQTLGGGVGVASKAFEKTSRTGSKKKKEPKEKETFYAFQKAEKQRKALLDLRKNFEADKARIDKMKESRRFKPY
ncbi:ribosomal RNA-processing protein 7-domain-containing protein [Boletus reticuloceps]|uniref:Ribosomal RNA-processing protein 7-domain-containing protein n=1 Tax=Boletus reticuloceps TaxID=495285 RepID=A0A8I3A713_9AGAM|nr:ribosomal RNA-processing protein 7-domain-containing protein [Boletus reticuloceps]